MVILVGMDAGSLLPSFVSWSNDFNTFVTIARD
jgi:hypothetical protein